MGGTHKKKIRQEKSKIKLKGSKLAKDTNVTKTDFKVRKINIRTQLKSVNIYGQQQTTINEILPRLKHHNTNIRMEALRTLNSALTSDCRQIELSGKLNEILQSIAAAALDVDKEVRRESFKSLNNFLIVLKMSVTPFFPAILSYLQCAMTHIQQSIQDDALLMLDILLDQVPNLVAQQSTKIMLNFLEMISHTSSEEGHKGRTLNVMNKGKKQTSVHWRFNVLCRLQQLLKVSVEFNFKNTGKTVIATQCDNIFFKSKEPLYLGIKHSIGSQCFCDNSSIFQRQYANDNQTLLIRNCIEQLMPLLFEAWQEVRPSIDQTNKNQVLLNKEAANTLKIILDIIVDLWNLVDIHRKSSTSSTDLCFQLESYSETFVSNFLQAGFPFERSEECDVSFKKNMSRKKLSPNEQFCIQQNINISHLLCRFSKRSTNRRMHEYGLVLGYLNKIVENLDSEMEFWGSFEYTLKFYLKMNCTQMFELNPEAIRKLFRSTVVTLMKRFERRDQIFNKLLILISGIAEDPTTYKTYGSQELDIFLEFLPKNLLNATIPKSVIVAMSALGKQINVIFLSNLNLLANEIIANVKRIKITGTGNSFEDKKDIMNLFYWIKIAKVIDVQRQQEILEMIYQNITDKSYLDYFMFLLK